MERETARTAEKETGAPGKIGAAEVRAAAEVLRRVRQRTPGWLSF